MKGKTFLFFAFMLASELMLAQSMFDYGKGDIFLKGSLPYVNSFNLDFGAFKKKNTGFIGVAGGLEFFFSQKHYLETSMGIMGDYFAPIGPADYDEGLHEQLISAFTRATFNHTNGVFSFGYGVNASYNIWAEEYEGVPPPNFVERNIDRAALGPVLTGYYHLGPCHAGIQYHGIFLTNGGTLYSHVISLDFGVHFRIRKKREGKGSNG